MFSLIEALRVAFPVIARLLGEPSFTEITRVYIKKHPPKTPVILFYGADFPAFLEGFEAVCPPALSGGCRAVGIGAEAGVSRG